MLECSDESPRVASRRCPWLHRPPLELTGTRAPPGGCELKTPSVLSLITCKREAAT